MNHTDRLYALVEELRAIAPRHRSARELAAGFEVSVRTIERDIHALQQSGVPIHAGPGGHGYALGESMSPSPLTFTPAEAVAVAVALSGARDTPFAFQARSALRKLAIAMSPPESGPRAAPRAVPRAVPRAIPRTRPGGPPPGATRPSNRSPIPGCRG